MATVERAKLEQFQLHSESDTSSIVSSVYSKSRTDFVEKVRASNAAVQSGDFSQAVALYTEALALDPQNYILYSNRSAALMKLGDHKRALEDAVAARQLNPKWAKAYYREGVALQGLHRDADALASFASGLAEDPKSHQLLQGLVEAAHRSPLKEKFGGLYSQLQKMRLDQSPFVVIAVLGQELLSAGCFAAAVVVLESALRIGTCSLKLRGSVFSALSSAHWGLNNTDKAIACMLQDLAIAKSLADQEGECRAHGNLGSAYHAKGNYKESLTHHRFQLVLALRLKDRATAASVLSSLGHVYTAIGDYPNALASHKQCVLLLKQEKDRLREAREIGNVGAVYLAMGDVDSSLECHREHLKLARQLKDKLEEARAYSNLGSAHHFKRQYEKAISFHNQVLNIAQELKDRTLEARAYAGLGHAARCCADYKQAKGYHEKQLDIALQTKDKVAEGRACSNLGIIYQLLSQYDAALKLHQAHLKIAKDLSDRTSQGRAYGNIGNAHSCLKQYDLAIRFHKQELAISKEVGDRHSEASTHGNLAVAYQALNMHEQALLHYQQHLQMSRELKDSISEARALNNLGNYHSSRKDFLGAVPFYEQFLILSQELHDVIGEGKACHRLGYAHYCLGQHQEAVRYYEQDLTLAKEREDKEAMCRAYCNLGLAHKALADYTQALECQRHFLATASANKDTMAQFCALSNIGDVLVKMGDLDEALKIFKQQLAVAKTNEDKKQELTCLSNLGSVHRVKGDLEQAMTFHQQELALCKELSDIRGECKAHGALGNVNMLLCDYNNAFQCYEAQLKCSRELRDPNIEAPVYGNLAITQMNSGQWDAAIGYLEQQLALLQQSNSPQTALQRGKAAGGLGDCYEALGDYEEAVRCQEVYLAAAQTAQSIPDQDRAYRGLGNAHRAMGNLQQALVCFEKRLVVAHELDKPVAKSSAYGELGCLHSLLGNFEQAVACLQHQLRIAREMGDQAAESDAACGLGGVYQQMADYDKALEYHALDLSMAQATENPHGQCRAYGNLGLSHESLGNFEKAISCQEQHLNIAAQINDEGAKTLAYSSLGRVHHAMGNFRQAVQYLQQGLQIAETSGRHEDEAKIRHRLGLALWGHAQLEESRAQLYKAAELFETIRRDQLISTDYKLSLFDLQTASYQALQRVLVALNRTDEALVVAERGRTRAFVDYLLERQQGEIDSWHSSLDSVPVTLDHILDTVERQKAAVLYYSIAAGFLYSWLLVPKKGIMKFHECNVSELEVGSDPEDTQSLRSLNVSTASLLDQYVGHVREALGVDAHLSGTPSRLSQSRSSLISRLSVSRSSFVLSETESEADDLWQQQLEELGDRLNAESDRTGFLRMVNRNHVFNASSLSLSSLLSVGSVSGLSRASARRQQGSKPPLSALYELLMAPMEEALAEVDCKELVLVLQGDLYLVPFAVLRGSQQDVCLYERYSLLVVPSIRAVQASEAISKQNRYNPDCSGAMVMGNVKLPNSVMEQWAWGPLPGAEAECRTVGEMLGVRAFTGSQATKELMTRNITNVEVLHFATHVSWKLAALVLSPSEFSSGTTSMHGNIERMDLNDSAASDINGTFDGPPLSDFLLTAADILNVQLSARLVVLSSGHTEDRAGRINADGVVGLTRAFLAAGAQCVLFSLWPLPEMASRVLLKTFYTGLLQGAPCSRALGDAMKSVQSMRQFAHPSNWAGWVLVGTDVRLSSKVALMGHALCQLLQTPTKSREAMRVVLHLVEKSLQRIHHGQRHAMYTTQASIQNKVGEVTGWRDLLTAVGFRLEGPVNGLPAAVFFPTSDPGDRLAQCSASLQALLGLPVPTLSALSKMVTHPDVGEAVTVLVRDVNSKFNQDATVQLQVPVRLWRAPGCHEFLASLGFDLVDVGKDEITVKSGKQANRRCLSFALQALVAVFDTQEAPRTLLLDSSSSMESLASSGSATSTSNFSKGSSPPGSPSTKRRSFFNPAEVDKLPSAKPGQVKSRHGSGASRRSAPDLNMPLVHQSAIRQKYSSPGSTSEDTDVVPSDGGEAPTGRRGYERHSMRGYLPSNAQPPVIYSSDSEDAGDPLIRASQSRGSIASMSSTLTSRSVGSGGMRRSRFRGSQASTRSSASDRTITGDTPPESQRSRERGEGKGERAQQFTLDGLNDRPEKGILKTRSSMKLSRSDDFDKRAHEGKLSKAKSLSNIDNLTESSSSDHMTLDPTSLAMKVLAETRQQRAALEKMQHVSMQRLQEKQLADSMSETGGSDIAQQGVDMQDTSAGHSSGPPSLSNKPIASVLPSVHVADNRKWGEPITASQLSRLAEDLASNTTATLSSSTSASPLVSPSIDDISVSLSPTKGTESTDVKNLSPRSTGLIVRDSPERRDAQPRPGRDHKPDVKGKPPVANKPKSRVSTDQGQTDSQSPRQDGQTDGKLSIQQRIAMLNAANISNTAEQKHDSVRRDIPSPREQDLGPAEHFELDESSRDPSFQSPQVSLTQQATESQPNTPGTNSEHDNIPSDSFGETTVEPARPFQPPSTTRESPSEPNRSQKSKSSSHGPSESNKSMDQNIPKQSPKLNSSHGNRPPSSPMQLRHSATSGFSRYVSPASYQPPPPYPGVTVKTPQANGHSSQDSFDKDESPAKSVATELNSSRDGGNAWYDSDSKDSDSSAFAPPKLRSSWGHDNLQSSLKQTLPFFMGQKADDAPHDSKEETPAASSHMESTRTDKVGEPPLRPHPFRIPSDVGSGPFQAPNPGSAFSRATSHQAHTTEIVSGPEQGNWGSPQRKLDENSDSQIHINIPPLQTPRQAALQNLGVSSFKPNSKTSTFKPDSSPTFASPSAYPYQMSSTPNYPKSAENTFSSPLRLSDHGVNQTPQNSSHIPKSGTQPSPIYANLDANGPTNKMANQEPRHHVPHSPGAARHGFVANQMTNQIPPSRGNLHGNLQSSPHRIISKVPNTQDRIMTSMYDSEMNSQVQDDQSRLREMSMRMFGPRSSSQRSIDSFRRGPPSSGENPKDENSSKKVMSSLC